LLSKIVCVTPSILLACAAVAANAENLMKSRLFIGFSLILILAGASPRALRLQSQSRRPKQSQIADTCSTDAIWRLVFRYLLLKPIFY
jgi:lipoprotein